MGLLSTITLLQTYRLRDYLGTIESTASLVDVLLPFLLVFVIVFAILQKSNILGEGRKNFNVVVALVLGLMFVLPHVVTNAAFSYGQFDPVDIVNKALPQISMVIIAVIMVFLLIGIWGTDVTLAGQSLPAIIAGISALIVLYIFGVAAGLDWVPRFGNFNWSDPTVQMVVIILVFGIIIWFITKEEKKPDQKREPADWLKELSETIKKK